MIPSLFAAYVAGIICWFAASALGVRLLVDRHGKHFSRELRIALWLACLHEALTWPIELCRMGLQARERKRRDGTLQLPRDPDVNLEHLFYSSVEETFYHRCPACMTLFREKDHEISIRVASPAETTYELHNESRQTLIEQLFEQNAKMSAILAETQKQYRESLETSLQNLVDIQQRFSAMGASLSDEQKASLAAKLTDTQLDALSDLFPGARAYHSVPARAVCETCQVPTIPGHKHICTVTCPHPPDRRYCDHEHGTVFCGVCHLELHPPLKPEEPS